jgi:hypothetical protein
LVDDMEVEPEPWVDPLVLLALKLDPRADNEHDQDSKRHRQRGVPAPTDADRNWQPEQRKAADGVDP